MPRLRPFRLVTVAALAFSGALACPGVHAQTAGELPDGLSWDCWLATSDPVSIRCLAAREGQPAADPLTDPMERLLLDHVHTLLHSGRTVEIEGILVRNLDVFQNGSIWTIRIWSVPYEASWLEDRPATLVRKTLCPPGITCNVLIVRP